MEYDISIRITFPEEITSVLRKEKQRYIVEYGSSYKSEPHVTLYVDHYTAEGYPHLLDGLRQLDMKLFAISLLSPKVRIENDRHRNLYIMDVTSKPAIYELHEIITKIADPYRSPFIREKKIKELEQRGIHIDGTRAAFEALGIPKEPFDPHITLGELDFDKPQADIAVSQKNLISIEGKEIIVSGVTVFYYGKGEGDEKAHLIEEITIPFNHN